MATVIDFHGGQQGYGKRRKLGKLKITELMNVQQINIR